MKSLCVFCGSNSGNRPQYLETARALGELIGRRGLTLVYGGGRVGLMGALADAALGSGARVIGIIPKLLLDREAGHRGLSELHVVDSMAVRKEKMGEMADAFLTLPGGIGTMDELFEAWTWTQLGLQDKPSGLLNLEGYYDALLQFLDTCTSEGFLRPRYRDALLVDTDLERLVDRLLPS